MSTASLLEQVMLRAAGKRCSVAIDLSRPELGININVVCGDWNKSYRVYSEAIYRATWGGLSIGDTIAKELNYLLDQHNEETGSDE